MIPRMLKTTNALIACCIIVALVFLEVPVQCYGESVTISPHKIVLNAKCKGESQDIQAIIRKYCKPLENGYSITSFEVSLLFDGIEAPVAQAHSLRYCAVDDNFLAAFDRQIIQENPAVIALAGTVVTATVRGSFTVSKGDHSIDDEFTGDDSVEISNPGGK